MGSRRAVLSYLAVHLNRLLVAINNAIGDNFGGSSASADNHDDITRLTANACHIVRVDACDTSPNLKAFDDGQLQCIHMSSCLVSLILLAAVIGDSACIVCGILGWEFAGRSTREWGAAAEVVCFLH
jgi:hypothetical protein